MGRNQGDSLAEKTEWLLEAEASHMKKEAGLHQSLGKQRRLIFQRTKYMVKEMNLSELTTCLEKIIHLLIITVNIY